MKDRSHFYPIDINYKIELKGMSMRRIVKGRGRGGHTSVCGQRWMCPGRARDHYARVISDQKWPLKKRPVIAISKQDQSTLS